MAIGKIFEWHNKQIIPKDDCYANVHIKKMFDTYPDEYLKLCAYLHYMNSMKPADNPYADIPLQERSDVLVNALGIEADVEDPVIIRALDTVKDMYHTTAYGLYRGIKTYLDRLGKDIETAQNDFSQRDGNSGNILKFIEKYDILYTKFKAAYREYDEETGNVRVRGGGKLALDENEEDEDDDL